MGSSINDFKTTTQNTWTLNTIKETKKWWRERIKLQSKNKQKIQKLKSKKQETSLLSEEELNIDWVWT